MKAPKQGAFCRNLWVDREVLNYLIFRYGREPPEDLAVSLDDFFEHGPGSDPYACFAIHRLIYDHILKGFGVLRHMKDLVYVALEVSVVLIHGYYCLSAQ